VSGQLKVADLFSGAGGLSEGFRQAGYRVMAGSDIDPDACATYALNFPDTRTINGDIRELAIRHELLEASAGVQVVVGGPPCQAFSQVRNHCRLIEDPKNSLYREFVRIVAKLEPMAFVMENVQGLEQMGVKEQVLEDLGLKGAYRVKAQLVDAADFGVPQTRQRIFFVGVHSSLRLDPPLLQGSGATSALFLERRNGSSRVRYEACERAGLFGSLLGQLSDPEDALLVTAQQAIADLSVLKAGERRDEFAMAELLPPSSAYQRRMREGAGLTIANTSVPRINADTKIRLSGLAPGGNVHDLPEDMTERYLTGELWGPSNGSGRLGRRHYYAYRRLHPGFWSWTLNTKADSVYHYKERRALSVREFARLQSFPDRFVFTTDPRRGVLPGRIEGGAGHSRYRQAGNAVPPRLARAIADTLSELLASGRRSRKTA
jgi:DNA (cytosine-5)-methyltransferase 1